MSRPRLRTHTARTLGVLGAAALASLMAPAACGGSPFRTPEEGAAGSNDRGPTMGTSADAASGTGSGGTSNGSTGSGAGGQAGSNDASSSGTSGNATGTTGSTAAGGNSASSGESSGGASTGEGNGGAPASATGSGGSGAAMGSGGSGGAVTIPLTCPLPGSQTAEIYTGIFDGSSCGDAIDPPRIGFWYAANDGTGGVQIPAPGGSHPGVLGGRRGDADCAMASQGSGFTDWGALIGFDFSVSEAGPCVYDATPYRGMVVYVRGTSSGGVGGENTVRVNLQALPTMPTSEGGDCTTTCNDHYGVFCTLDSAAYGVCDLPFSSITTEGWGIGQGAFDPTRLRGVQIKVARSMYATTVSWNIVVDDILFY